MNVAARLEQLCEPGGVLVSGTAYDHLQGKLDLPLEFAGEQQLKNIERPVRAYRVRLDGVRASRGARPRRGVAAMGVPPRRCPAGARRWPPARSGGSGRASRRSRASPRSPCCRSTTWAATRRPGRLADGITEDIITDLSRFRDLDVIARNSTVVYKGKPVDVRQVGKDLNVRYVLEGSIQRQGEQVRVTAQLVDAATGAHVWSERWDRPAEDVFAVQTEIAERGCRPATEADLSAPRAETARRPRPPGA